MPLPLPKLDKLTYDELVAEARASLPDLAPTWTDYNAHDPGITLLELLAWLTEINSYRLDIIPEQAYRAYLKMVGITLKPAQAAETLLVFAADALPIQLPAGVQVPTKNSAVQLQTQSPLYVSDAKLQAVVSSGATLHDLTTLNMPTSSGFSLFGNSSEQGAAIYLGFDKILAPEGKEIRLGFWTGHTAEDSVTKTLLQQEHDAIAKEQELLCSPQGRPTDPGWRQHYAVQTVWEYHTGNNQWQPLQDVIDDTRAFTLTGEVSFKAPAIGQHIQGGLPITEYQGNYFIRCRLANGRYDCPPRIVYIALNVVASRHAHDVAPETFQRTSNGRAGQRFTLANKPVVPGSTKLKLTPNDQEEDWQEAFFWDGYGPFDRGYLLEPETGAIVFGDGRVGRVPPDQAKIHVSYQVGGGSMGNVASNPDPQPILAHLGAQFYQPFAAVGGADAETLNQAKARAVRELETPARAITLNDFETLSRATPGVPIARVHAIADYHPAMPCIPVSGSITVVVLPPCPQQRPEPTPVLIATVQRYLERRRMLTGEIHVVGPHYSTVSISARLQLKPGTDRRKLIDLAQCELERYLHPLYGGPDKKGWPIGRAIYRSELLAVLNNLNGVRFVEDLTWRLDGQAASRCGNITLCRHGLVASGIHEITINEGSVCHE